jgi:hypothetical protein
MKHGVMVMQATIRRLWKNLKTLNTSICKHVAQITFEKNQISWDAFQNLQEFHSKAHCSNHTENLALCLAKRCF